MQFYEQLRAQREARGYTRQEMADLLGISIGTYGHYEIGRRVPKIETMKKICGMLGIVIQPLFPVMVTVEIPAEHLQALRKVRDQVATELKDIRLRRAGMTVHDLLWETKPMINNLWAALEPVQKEWQAAMEITAEDYAEIPDGKSLGRITYRPEDLELLVSANKLYEEVLGLVFEET